ncbi:hypothetical protein Ocin01_12321 [Orchesella cincta]|uniref:Uncharacterized protein n=1 Tax=Orchesella cincta TaxID=48709 RepID=A0A1D2MMV0_ORCCI|nr:hypothetical protein Ocin01_12321 [Orchesella cincta]
MNSSITKFPAMNKVFPEVHPQPQRGAQSPIINGNDNDHQLTRIIAAARYAANVSTAVTLLLALLIIAFFGLVNFFSSPADSYVPYRLENYDPNEVKEYLYLNSKRRKLNHDYYGDKTDYNDYHPVQEEKQTAEIDYPLDSTNNVAQQESFINFTWPTSSFSSYSRANPKDGVASQKGLKPLMNNTHCSIMNIFYDIRETPLKKNGTDTDTAFSDSLPQCSLDGNLTTLYGNKALTFLMGGRDLRCCAITKKSLSSMRKNQDGLQSCTIIRPRNGSLHVPIKSRDITILLKCNDTNVSRSHGPFNQLLINIRKEAAIKQKMEYWKLLKRNQKEVLLSILFIGIDGLSKFKARKYMPETLGLLKAANFVEMKGYHSVDNMGNFLPLFMGLPYENFMRAKFRSLGSDLDEFPFVWSQFYRSKYITTFIGEPPEVIRSHFYSDEVPNFDYFVNDEFTDFVKESMPQACNVRSNLQWKFDALQLVLNRHTSTPTLTLFWMNNNINLRQMANISGDSETADKLKKIMGKNSVIFFITNAGYSNPIMEDDINEHRLPSLFIRLPKKLTENVDKSPGMKYFLENQDRLVTPLTVYRTLQWLHNSIPTSSNTSSFDSLNNKNEYTFSLFDAIPETLTCQAQKIPAHFCTCDHREFLPITQSDENRVFRMRRKAMSYINNIVTRYFDEEDKCVKLEYHKTTQIKKYLVNDELHSDYHISYVFNLQVIPSGNIFQAKFSFFPKTNNLTLIPPVDVLNLERQSKFDGYCYSGV